MIVMDWIKRRRKLLLVLGSLLVLFFLLPVADFNDPGCTILEDEKGELLSARISPDGQWRFPLCDSVPGKFSTCILHFEDRYFRWHPGVNPVSLIRALVQNIRQGEIVSGGSTISMQVVRLSRQGKPRTLWQKCIEIILALRLETARDKDEILRLYASNAPFGGNVVGIDAAAWRYYGKPSHLLSWGEAACLAVLPNAPSLVYPGKNQDRLLAKRNRLLDMLRDRGVLDAVSCDLAREEPLPGLPHALPMYAQHLLDRTEKEGYRGQRSRTTLQKDLQVRLNQVTDRHHDLLSQNGIHNAAVLILDIGENKVIAYTGNTRSPLPHTGSRVDIIRAERSSGSILKPLLYAMMLDEGIILPNSLVADIPTYISGYSPVNFDLGYSGAVPASTALVRSLNVPAVRMLQDYGLERFHSQLSRLGFTSIDRDPGHYGLTLILGGAEVRLWDLCRVYMGMASTLNHIESYGYRYDPLEYRDPVYLSDQVQRETQVPAELSAGGPMSASSIWHCFQTLTRLERPGMESSWEQFYSSRRIAWKTGTSFGHRDAWAIGVCPDYVVGVWVGNAGGEGRPGLTGLNSAAPLLFDAFSLLPPSGWFSEPLDEMQEISVCSQSGFRAGPDCPDTRQLRVPLAGERADACPYHVRVHLDAQGRHRVNSSCYEVDMMKEASCFVLPPLMEWYYRNWQPSYRGLPPLAQGCVDEEAPMELIYPRENAGVFIPRTLEGELSRVVFEVSHRKPGTGIHWHLDEQYLGTTRVIHQMELTAKEGMHSLVLVDENGYVLEKQIGVLSN